MAVEDERRSSRDVVLDLGPERFRVLMEQTSDGVFLVDRAERFVEVNAVTCAMLGYRRDELEGRAVADVVPEGVVDGVSASRTPMRVVRMLAAESRLRRKDGTLVAVEGSMHVLADGMYLGIARDLSRQRPAEQALPLNEERLRLAARVARSENLQAIGQMASGVAHDLSQSLALIAGYTDLARETVTRLEIDAPRLAEALEVAAQAAIDAGESVTRLLAYSRGQPSGAAAPVDVAVVLRDVARLTAPRWRNEAWSGGHPIGLSVEVDGRDLVVRGWGSSLREAITNLVFNAVDALPDGGDIRLVARRQGERVVVEVTDTGTGMAPDLQARIFEPFFTTKGEYGTGLGLYTVRQVAERHGGLIQVQSAPGQGTTFRLELPAEAPPDDVAQPPRSEESGRDEARRRVLVIDDDPRLAQMVRAMLAHHHVVTATSGEEALVRLTAQPFDVIVSDLGMGPGINGWELAERVRERWPETRFVLATGWGASITQEEARRRGIEAVLAKPFSVRQLWQLLDGPPANQTA